MIAAASVACLSTLNAGPNILLISADDLGYGEIGAYGQDRIETPCLDALAERGMRFTQAYAGATVCAPSRAALLTGRHTGHTQIRGNPPRPLSKSTRTFVELLQASGYRTVGVGKWDSGEQDTTGAPWKQGFDLFFGYLDQVSAHNYYPDYLFRNDERIELPNTVEYISHGYAAGVGGISTNKEVYAPDLFIDFIEDQLDQLKDEKFFLYVSFTFPHANNESTAMGDLHGMEIPDLGIYSDRDWPPPEAAKAAMITRMDRDVSRIIARLKAHGIEKKTLIIFISDNGPHSEGGVDPSFFKASGPLRG